MSSPELNEQFLAKITGWDILKQARGVLAGGRVLSSNFQSIEAGFHVCEQQVQYEQLVR